MRVLGIDPGTRFTGFGVIDEVRGRLVHVAHGVVRADADAPLEQRLHQIWTALRHAMTTYRPDAVAVEGLFSHKNARSALILGHARGVALLVAAESGLPVHEYAPARVKKSVGAGGADGKHAVARMVTGFLRLAEIERADASDALAVAICHLNHARFAPLGPAPVRPAAGRKNRKAAFAALSARLAPALVRAVVPR